MKIQKEKLSMNLMTAMYFFAGLNHFIMTEFYIKIMPPYLPFHREIVYLSGIAEMGLGIGFYSQSTRKYSALGIILLLLAVFPANVYQYTSRQMNGTAFVIRVIMQVLLIYWAAQYINHKNDKT